MKKRIIISSVITVIFALMIITYSFVGLLEIRELDQVNDLLKVYSEIVKSNNYTVQDIEKFNINDNKVGVFVLDASSNIIYNSTNDNVNNIISNENMDKILNNGELITTNYNKLEEKNYAYYASKMDDGVILVVFVELNAIKLLTFKEMLYYLIIMILVLVLSIGLSFKLVRAIIFPLKELELTTSKIANGDLSKRAKIYANDEIGKLASTFNDMADLLQQKIKDSTDKKNKLEAILESMESGVIAVDNKYNIMLVNPYAKKIFEINQNIIGENIEEHISDYEVLKFIKSISQIETKEIKLENKSCEEIRIKKAPIIGINRYSMGIVITIQDITDIKRLENMRSEFVANVSHELKTPLTSIKGFAETLKYVDDDDTRNKFLGIINTEAERLTRLINDILVLSKIESDNRPALEEFKVDEIIDNVIEIVGVQAKEKSIKLKCIKDDNLALRGDRDRFVQLVVNLVENSIRYSESNKEIYIKTYKKGKDKYLEIIDQGVGISEEDLPRIFERFYRVDKSRVKGGTGLGLAIVKHIVKIFNGEIVVKSKIGEGTTFIVKFKSDDTLDNCEY